VERPADTTPEYAGLSIGYGAGLASLAVAAERRGMDRGALAAELPALALATFGASRVMVHERIASWARRPFVRPVPGEPPRRGPGIRRALGELVRCSRCTGAWVGLGLVALRLVAPAAGRAVTLVLATIGANHLLQAAFAALARRAG
jgi:hypothetical protein